jgi:hypothetical protein
MWNLLVGDSIFWFLGAGVEVGVVVDFLVDHGCV